MYRQVNFLKREKTLDLTARRGVLKNRGFQKQKREKERKHVLWHLKMEKLIDLLTGVMRALP